MKSITIALTFSFGTVGAALCLSPIANAGGPVSLSENQLDHVTAGGSLVFSTADALASGSFFTQASAGANSAFGTNTGVQDGFGSEAGLAGGTAVALGSNGARPNSPPATSNTAVTTGGVPEGNYTMTITQNKTSSALGLTIQGGFTFVYGVFIPGL